VLCSVLDSPVQQRHGHTQASPVKGNKDDCGVEVSDTTGKSETAGTVRPGAKAARGDLINVYKHLKKGGKKMEPGSSQWCPVKGEEVTGTV